MVWSYKLFADPTIDPSLFPEWQNLDHITSGSSCEGYLITCAHIHSNVKNIRSCNIGYITGDTVGWKWPSSDDILLPKTYQLRQALIWRWQLSQPCSAPTCPYQHGEYIYDADETRLLIQTLTGESLDDIDLMEGLANNERRDGENISYAESQCKLYDAILKRVGDQMITNEHTTLIEQMISGIIVDERLFELNNEPLLDDVIKVRQRR